LYIQASLRLEVNQEGKNFQQFYANGMNQKWSGSRDDYSTENLQESPSRQDYNHLSRVDSLERLMEETVDGIEIAYIYTYDALQRLTASDR
jgi:hypothetical protein